MTSKKSHGGREKEVDRDSARFVLYLVVNCGRWREQGSYPGQAAKVTKSMIATRMEMMAPIRVTCTSNSTRVPVPY